MLRAPIRAYTAKSASVCFGNAPQLTINHALDVLIDLKSARFFSPTKAGRDVRMNIPRYEGDQEVTIQKSNMFDATRGA